MAVGQADITLILRRPGRQAEEEWETIEPEEAAFWQEASRELSSRSYEHKGCRITLSIDWTPLGRRIIRDHNILKPIRTGQPWKESQLSKVGRTLKFPVKWEVAGENDLSSHSWYPAFFVEYFIYEVFTVANLCCPGAAEFYSLSIQNNPTREQDDLRLSAFYFGEWRIESLRGAKPPAKILPVTSAIAWFRAVNPRVTQKAESSTQRALFSLYHLCRSDGQVDFILWLFNGLESLLSTRVGENFSGLVRRASLLLQLTDREAAELSKRLRKLYDVRSSFVHGGYEVAHPMHVEPVDERLNEDYQALLQLGIYGFSVLSALLQAMIEKGMSEARFGEQLVSQRDVP